MDQNLVRLKEAKRLIEEKNYPEAIRLVNKCLDHEPDDPHALFLFAFIAMEEERWGISRTVLKRCLEIEPNQSEVWNAYGRTFQEGHDLEEAEKAFQRAMACNPKNPHPYLNLGLLYVVKANPKRVMQYMHKALQIDPELPEAQYNRGLAKLMLHEWEAGWIDYEHVLGRVKNRTERVYKVPPEPRWNGQKKKVVVAYGEQGLGDEITFASCLPDLIKDSKQVIIDCDRRLEPLFKRSFPDAIVHGDRFAEDVPWLHDYDIDYRVAFGSLPKVYRNKDSDFPRKTWLVPDPELVVQYRALLDSLGDKPKIGIAWTGGVKATGKERRSVKLETFLPLLKLDATFISLEYLDSSEEIQEMEKHGLKVHHWPNIVEVSQDYDNTVALISQLDLVIGVTTTALRVVGALGVPCIAMVQKWPIWAWYGEYLWSDIKIYRQKDSWSKLITKVARDVNNKSY